MALASEYNDINTAYQLVVEAEEAAQADNLNALEKASEQGDVEEVKKQMAIIDPRLNKSRALVLAAGIGNIDIMKLLFPKSNENDFWDQVRPMLKKILTNDPSLAKEFAAMLLRT